MAKNKKDAGKKAMFNEAKALEAKGRKQTAKVPPSMAPEDPMSGKGVKPDLSPGRDFRGMKNGKKDTGPFGKLPAKKKHK